MKLIFFYSKIGKVLLDRAKDHLEISEGRRSIAINSVLKQSAFYEQRFNAKYAWDIICYSGTPDLQKLENFSLQNTKVVKITQGNLQKFLDYGSGIHQSYDRRYFEMISKEGNALLCAALRETDRGKFCV